MFAPRNDPTITDQRLAALVGELLKTVQEITDRNRVISGDLDQVVDLATCRALNKVAMAITTVVQEARK